MRGIGARYWILRGSEVPPCVKPELTYSTAEYQTVLFAAKYYPRIVDAVRAGHYGRIAGTNITSFAERGLL